MSSIEATPTFVFASDSLKGTLSSQDTARLLGVAARKHFPSCTCVAVPMADGGEGTTEALVEACGGTYREVCVHDPLGRRIVARYGLLGGGRALIEVAAASGLPLLVSEDRDPLKASSFGTGELVLDAIKAGCTDITLALGGSATNDGGMGLVRALGVRFLDADGNELKGCGADLGRVASIDTSALAGKVRDVRFHVMCDVDNPLFGAEGASAVFGPQKGADRATVARLDEGMRSYAAMLDKVAVGPVDFPGAGAAGGIASACSALLGADFSSGIEKVLSLVHFDSLLDGAALCVTGEGKCDAQTARGKVVSGVAAACARAGVPCVAVVGGMSTGSVGIPGLAAIVPTPTAPMPLDEALRDAEELYALAADRLFSLLAIGSTWK